MLVDLARNDLGRISDFSSVRVMDYLMVHRYSKIMHIASRVESDVRADCDALDAIEAILPAGTLSGAPKIRACEIIEELEREPRGIYGGALGMWTSPETSTRALPSAWPSGKTAQSTVQAGGGIVADSVPETEYEEAEKQGQGRHQRNSQRKRGGRLMILIIDNYDSFTYNLVQLIGGLNPGYPGSSETTQKARKKLRPLRPLNFILSPGPGYPKDGGICEELIIKLGSKSDPGRLPWPSGHLRSLWRQNQPRAQADARKKSKIHVNVLNSISKASRRKLKARATIRSWPSRRQCQIRLRSSPRTISAKSWRCATGNTPFTACSFTRSPSLLRRATSSSETFCMEGKTHDSASD
jgi:hypothetical protein